MDIHASEREQVEQLKMWWNKYGKLTLTAVLFAIAASLGWQFWQGVQNKRADSASNYYQHMMIKLYNKDIVGAKAVGQILRDDFSGTAYSEFAALMLAQQAINAHKLDAASKQLQWAMGHTRNERLKTIAALRYARVLVAQHRYQQANTVLAGIKGAAFAPAVAEVKGDLFMREGELKAARQAYQRALNLLPTKAPLRSLLQMKLVHAGGMVLDKQPQLTAKFH